MILFKERLRELRLVNKMSQKQLADAVSLSEKTISHYENGYSQPNFEILEKLCVLFETTAGYIIGFEE